MTPSNWINVGIFVVTTLAGILAWLGARNAAREARADQREANAAAARSAAAAEEATNLQKQIIELERDRDHRTGVEARRARLRAEHGIKKMTGGYGITEDKHYILIVNDGTGEARNLTLVIDGKWADACEWVKGEILTGAVVGGRSRFEIPIKWQHGGRILIPQHSVFELEWDDETDERGNWKGTITLV